MRKEAPDLLSFEDFFFSSYLFLQLLRQLRLGNRHKVFSQGKQGVIGRKIPVK
jgi:hypothetical protein